MLFTMMCCGWVVIGLRDSRCLRPNWTGALWYSSAAWRVTLIVNSKTAWCLVYRLFVGGCFTYQFVSITYFENTTFKQLLCLFQKQIINEQYFTMPCSACFVNAYMLMFASHNELHGLGFSDVVYSLVSALLWNTSHDKRTQRHVEVRWNA